MESIDSKERSSIYKEKKKRVWACLPWQKFLKLAPRGWFSLNTSKSTTFLWSLIIPNTWYQQRWWTYTMTIYIGRRYSLMALIEIMLCGKVGQIGRERRGDIDGISDRAANVNYTTATAQLLDTSQPTCLAALLCIKTGIQLETWISMSSCGMSRDLYHALHPS